MKKILLLFLSCFSCTIAEAQTTPPLFQGSDDVQLFRQALMERVTEVYYSDGYTPDDLIHYFWMNFTIDTLGLEMIERFRKSGFQVEIDDFGSGYSSFNTLKDMDVDVLKIDMGFLRTTRPERLERSMSIINTIISLTKTLGLSVITEGVETKEQIDELTRMGCGIYQGYYFSKPIPVGQFEDTYL